MARILFIGAPVSSPPLTASTQQKFDLTGKNTGNLLIGHALRHELVVDAYEVGTHHNPHEAHRQFDLIAIPAANFIYEHFDFGYMADFIEKTKLPCLMVGLGAQSNDINTVALTIPDGTKRLLRIVSDRSHSIGVRGEYTAAVLAHLGIKNITLTGCPSLYMNLTPELTIRKRTVSDGALKVTVNGSNNVVRHSFAPAAAADVERQLLEMAIQCQYPYVLQNEFPEIDVALGVSSDTQPNQLSGSLQRIGSSLSRTEYRAFLAACGRVFFGIDEWRAFIREMDLSIGTRFHGNMMALLSGVPAIILPHDTRTLEMSRLMKVPHISVHTAGRLDVRALYDQTDFSEFSENYKKLYRDYAAFLDGNGVRHRLAHATPSIAAAPAHI